MDSRLLYSITHALANKIDWTKSNQQEWIHFGTAIEIDYQKIENVISKQFKKDDVYIVYSRSESGHLKYHKELFDSLIGKQNFFLWNNQLTKVIAFNSVDILRCGQINYNTSTTSDCHPNPIDLNFLK